VDFLALQDNIRDQIKAANTYKTFIENAIPVLHSFYKHYGQEDENQKENIAPGNATQTGLCSGTYGTYFAPILVSR
jgi:hypothetical protein